MSDATVTVDVPDADAYTLVRVNTRALAQPFHPCDPDFIRDVCHAKCCRSTTDPTGIAVTVTPAEATRVRLRGFDVDDETLRIAPVDRLCPFQSATTHLCSVHADGEEPLGCVVSPFTVNANDTLIVRNRYRMLPCFKAPGSVPVAVAHRRSLVAIFDDHADAIIDAVVLGLDVTMTLPVPRAIVRMLHHKNTASKGGA